MSTASNRNSSVNGWSIEYLEELYANWLVDPESIDPSWNNFFQGFELGLAHSKKEHGIPAKQSLVDSLIYHYRDIGHYAATIDPLQRHRPKPNQLELESFGLNEVDLKSKFDPGHLPFNGSVTLEQIIDKLEKTYCRNIGIEYMHIEDRDQRRWIQDQIEKHESKPQLSDNKKLRILNELTAATTLEQFLNTRYVGKKRFGLDGGESIIPTIDALINKAGEHDIKSISIGMAHRGRLNVLVNILGKSYDQLFTEFEESWIEDFIDGGGDVKYHRGYGSNIKLSSGKEIYLTLSDNPSHLEFGHSVVLGKTRALQRRHLDDRRKLALPLLLHGDAAIAGQGIVSELFNMAHLEGYCVGGAVHVVINNQIGYTTEPKDLHSGSYCTDIAKMIKAPIFHINGDDPESCAWIAELALDYRQKFSNDVVLDIWCYRKYGHNETDEPGFTQPVMYSKINTQQSVLEKYKQKLMEKGLITNEDFNAIVKQIRTSLDDSQSRTKVKPVEPVPNPFDIESSWKGLNEPYPSNSPATGLPKEKLHYLIDSITTIPKNFNPHKKINRLMIQRRMPLEKNTPLDWGLAENLAYASLLTEGIPVRLSGQDVERGTFSHRHVKIFDQGTNEAYEPLNNLKTFKLDTCEPARFCVHNSPLSENGVLGFEYGYAAGDPNILIEWEAQFGDFANGAQVIIDQFIASAQLKWNRHNGLVLLLPHGYEGMGPEHSSARLERFLELASGDNIEVAYPTTPAQIFHLLRRQMHRPFRRPLIVMTPKSLLRLPEAVSNLDEFVSGKFEHTILESISKDKINKTNRIILCTGKVFYGLNKMRKELNKENIPILRIELLHPFPIKEIKEKINKFIDNDTEIIWVQEEPLNMGAWRYLESILRHEFGKEPIYVGRQQSASPAVASAKIHQEQQIALEKAAFEGLDQPFFASSKSDMRSHIS